MRKAVKKILVGAYLGVNRRVGPLIERVLSLSGARAKRPAQTPIFIVGAPRSGTTLTFQLVVHGFQAGYLTNTHCRLFGAPALASLLLRKRDRSIAFESDYGRTAGRYGPSECGEWWYRFFPRDPAFVRRKDMSAKALADFKRSLATLGTAEGRPLVFKNLYAGLRMDPIIAAFPDALFLHVRRDRMDNAVSILEGRHAANGNYETWWSVPPSGYEALLGHPPARQVLSQIELIDAQIENDVRDLGLEQQVLSVRYEDICADPAAFLDRVQSFLSSRGVDLQMAAPPPKEFEPRRKNRLPTEMIEALHSLMNGPANDA